MRFQRDDRGVSELLGAILVFGLVIAVLAIFQVNAVPADNAAVEFTHDQAAQSDFQMVRTAIIEAAGADEPRSATVDLGVTYPNRLIFVNPGPVAGQLRTVDAEAYDTNNPSDVNLYQICGFGDSSQAVPTKSLDYSVDYNVYAGDPVLQYENSIVHQRYANSDAELVRNDQRIIRGNTISLFPLVGDVEYSGTNSQSIDFVSAGTSLATRDPSNQWVLYVPTSLSADTWRDSDQLLAGELSKNVVSVDEGAAGDGRIEVTMKPGKYNFRCTVIGVNETPAGVTPINDTGDDDADDTGEINPVSDGSLKYVGSTVETDDTVTVTWQNIGSSPITVDAVRLPFYNADSQGNSGGSTATSGTFDGTSLDVGDAYVELPDGPAYTVDAGATFQATMEFYCGLGDQFLPGTGDYFAVALETTVGDTTGRDNYFVTPISDRSGNSNRCKGSLQQADGVTISTTGSTGPSGSTSGVSFEVTSGSSGATIDGVKVTSGSTADKLAETASSNAPWTNEVFVDADTDGFHEAGDNPNNKLNIGSKTAMTQNAEISAGSTATVYLYEFRENNGTPVSLTGETVTVTLYFSDGSSKDATITIP